MITLNDVDVDVAQRVGLFPKLEDLRASNDKVKKRRGRPKKLKLPLTAKEFISAEEVKKKKTVRRRRKKKQSDTIEEPTYQRIEHDDGSLTVIIRPEQKASADMFDGWSRFEIVNYVAAETGNRVRIDGRLPFDSVVAKAVEALA